MKKWLIASYVLSFSVSSWLWADNEKNTNTEGRLEWRIMDNVSLVRRISPPTSIALDGSLVTHNGQRLLQADGLEKNSLTWREDQSISNISVQNTDINTYESAIYFNIQKFKDGNIEYLYLKDPISQNETIVAFIDYKGAVRFLPQFVPVFEYNTEKSIIRITLRKVKL